jgi:hypothetical protein
VALATLVFVLNDAQTQRDRQRDWLTRHGEGRHRHDGETALLNPA